MQETCMSCSILAMGIHENVDVEKQHSATLELIEERRRVVEVDARSHPTAGNGRELDAHTPAFRSPSSQDLAKGVLDDRSERSARVSRQLLRLHQQFLVDADGRPHASEHTHEAS